MKEDSVELADEAIVAQVVAGNADAFALLIDRYQHHVFRVVGRHVGRQDVEEAAHDAFVAAYRSLRRFDHSGSFKSWLTVIAVRTCYDFWRQRYRCQEVAISALSAEHLDWLEKAVENGTGEAVAGIERRYEARELLHWLLARLSPPERMVVELIYLEGRACGEAAEILGWSVANVKIRSYRARQRMKRLLEGLVAKP